MGYDPTPEQQAAIDAFCGRGENLALEAGAGTGKTSTLRFLGAGVPTIPSTGMPAQGVYMAYNRSIADEAARAFPPNVICKTGHSHTMSGMQQWQWQRNGRGPRQTARDVAMMLGINGPERVSKDVVLAPQQIASATTETIERFARSGDMDVTSRHVPIRKRIDTPADRAAFAAIVVPWARQAWADLMNPEGRMKWNPDVARKVFHLEKRRLPGHFLFLDEAQDSNGVTIAIAKHQQDNGMRVVAVGDQCQPTGTMVTVVDEVARRVGRHEWSKTTTKQVPIEDLKTGDHVVSYNMAKHWLRRSGSPISGITVRPYKGDLVTVTADDRQTQYTPEHHVVARFAESIIDKHVVYVMRRGSDYRVGTTGARYASGKDRIGVVARAGQEGADAAWIVAVCDSRREALLLEQNLAWRHNVPDVCFSTSNRSTIDPADLDAFWSEGGGNRTQAATLLHAFGRSIDHPLWTKGDRLWYRRPFVTAAANLMDGMLVLPLHDSMMDDPRQINRTSWRPITVGYSAYDGPVYSMTVEGDHTYVGDGIVTHNCQAINGWMGAIDAMDQFGGTRLQLSKSFRFGPAIAAEANKWLDLLDASLRITGHDPVGSTVGPLGTSVPDAVLTRTNAKSVEEAMRLTEAGVKVSLVKTVGQQIERLAKAAKELKSRNYTSHEELCAFTSWGQVQEYVENDHTGSDLKVFVDLVDRHTPDVIITAMQALTDSQDAQVTISTAHRSKGMEWDRVRIASDFERPLPDKNGDQPVPSREDLMLAYVAVTRAKTHLDLGGLSWVNDLASAGTLVDPWKPNMADPTDYVIVKHAVESMNRDLGFNRTGTHLRDAG